MTLTEFLLARIAEDEADPWRGAELIGTDRVVGRAEREALAADEREWVARALAECVAKRRIVNGHTGWHVCPNLTDEGYTDYGDGSGDEWEAICPTLRTLAAIYADHPDFNPDWT